MTAINLPFAASVTRRAPTSDELAGGYGCGDADLDLFNWMAWWLTGQVAGAIDAAGLTVDDTILLRLAQAIQSGKSTYAVASGTANAWTIAPNLAVPAYAAGLSLRVMAPATNTSTTVNANISGLGNRRIKKADGSDPAVGDLVLGRVYVTIDDGTNIRIVTTLPSEFADYSQNFVTIVDQKPVGTGGGSFVEGAWRTRDLNTVIADPKGLVSAGKVTLAANRITLAPGLWSVRAAAPAAGVNQNKARFYNMTATAVALVGTTENSTTAPSDEVTTWSLVEGIVNIATASQFELQHAGETAGYFGQGRPSSLAGVITDPEQYARVTVQLLKDN